jgi:hypothetical protein
MSDPSTPTWCCEECNATWLTEWNQCQRCGNRTRVPRPIPDPSTPDHPEVVADEDVDVSITFADSDERAEFLADHPEWADAVDDDAEGWESPDV